MKRLYPLALWLFLVTGAMASTSHWPQWAQLLPPCPFRELTGLPCPTCGTTRAALALGQGNLGQAISINPLAVATLLGAAGFSGWLAFRCAMGRPVPLWLRSLQFAWPLWLRGAVWLLLAGNWLWLLMAG
ncbi:MAG: DUF2752 domain-containing protein [Thermoanaerobaculaceae bacterium]